MPGFCLFWKIYHMAIKLLEELVLETLEGIDVIPAGTYIMAEGLESPGAKNLPKMYENLKQLNPGMTFYGDPTDSDDDIDVKFRSGGDTTAARLIGSDIIPNEWKQAAQAEGYTPDEIILFILNAQLVPIEPRQEEEPTGSYICDTCNGSGEGQYPGTRCGDCRGSGERKPVSSSDW